MINTEKLISVQKTLTELTEKYSGQYDKLRENADISSADVIWCKGWREPYAADYADELYIGNIYSPRQMLAKEPRKKELVSAHYFRDSLPVLSVVYGTEGKITYEKLFVNEPEISAGIVFDDEQNADILTVEIKNNGRAAEYIVYEHDRDSVPGRRTKAHTVRYTSYAYDENGRIASSTYITGITPCDDTEKFLLLNKRVEDLCDYRFNYVDTAVDTFTRYDFDCYYFNDTSDKSYPEGNTWKFPKHLLKRYRDLGIDCFG